MYDKDLFAIMHRQKAEELPPWKRDHKHINHQPLHYLQSQSKMQQVKHYKWLGFLQQFHLLIKYKKWATNKIACMLSGPLLNKIAEIGVIMQLEPLTCDLISEDCEGDEDFKGI